MRRPLQVRTECRSCTPKRGGISRVRPGRHFCWRRYECGGAATGDPHHSDCVRGLTDPVGAGFVESLSRPGGNTTGFTAFEYGISTKWVELLKEIAPRVTRVGVLREQGSSGGIGFWAAMQGAAPSLGMELRPIGARDAPEIERGIAAFARGPNGGMIVPIGGLTITHRDLISTLAARYQLPAVYPFRYFVTTGGPPSYR